MTHPLLSERAAFLAQRPRNRMSALAAKYQDVIGLSRGDPDLPTPPHIVEAAYRAARDGQTHYTPTLGIVPLREAISAKLRRENGVDYGADEVMITSGGQEAICVVMQSILNPGDEVILPSPTYTSYVLAAQLAGGVPVQVPLNRDQGFQLDLAEVERRITPRTKAIVVVSPNNPTGTVLSREALEGVADMARRHNLLVISDEIYEKILFDGATHHSIASFPEMQPRTIIVNGFSKAYSMTGWRAGREGRALDLHVCPRPACRPGRPHRAAGLPGGNPVHLRTPPDVAALRHPCGEPAHHAPRWERVRLRGCPWT